MSEELELEEHTCPFCELSQEDCKCENKCPVCGGETDPLDGSICVGCESYHADCTCRTKTQESQS